MDERIIIRNVVILVLVSFVITLGYGAIMPIIPFILLYFEGKLSKYPEELGTISNIGNIAFEIALIMSAFMIVRAFFARQFGKMSDKIGRKKLIITGTALYALLAIIFAMTTSWVEILVVRVVQGVASAMVWPVAEAMLADSVPPELRGKYMGLYMAATNVGWFASPIMGAYLYKFAAYSLRLSLLQSLMFPIYILFVLAMVSLGLVLFTKETVGIKGHMKAFNDGQPLSKVSIDLSPEVSRSIKAIYVMGFANGVAVGFIMPILSVYIIQYISSDPEAIGWLSTISGIFGFLVNYPAGKLSDKYSRKPFVIFGQIGVRLSTFLIPFVRVYEYLVTLWTIRAVMFNISSPPYRALQADLVPLRIRGKVFGNVQAMFNFGASVAPVGGYAYKILQQWKVNFLNMTLPGVAILFWVSALIGFISTIIFILFVIEPEMKF